MDRPFGLVWRIVSTNVAFGRSLGAIARVAHGIAHGTVTVAFRRWANLVVAAIGDNEVVGDHL